MYESTTAQYLAELNLEKDRAERYRCALLDIRECFVTNNADIDGVRATLEAAREIARKALGD
jgi:hypothetical protein